MSAPPFMMNHPGLPLSGLLPPGPPFQPPDMQQGMMHLFMGMHLHLDTELAALQRNVNKKHDDLVNHLASKYDKSMHPGDDWIRDLHRQVDALVLKVATAASDTAVGGRVISHGGPAEPMAQLDLDTLERNVVERVEGSLNAQSNELTTTVVTHHNQTTSALDTLTVQVDTLVNKVDPITDRLDALEKKSRQRRVPLPSDRSFSGARRRGTGQSYRFAAGASDVIRVLCRPVHWSGPRPAKRLCRSRGCCCQRRRGRRR